MKINGAITIEKNAIEPNSIAVANKPMMISAVSMFRVPFLAQYFSR